MENYWGPGAIVGILSAIGTAIAWYVARRDRAKDPIPKAAAEIQLAQAALGVIQDAADFSRQNVVDLRADAKADRERIKQLEADREVDRARLTRLETLLSHAASYIEALLRWAREITVPPNNPIPPLPSQLHELVDPQLWITNNEEGK